MATLKLRSYQGETDWQAIVNLVEACETIEKLDEEATTYELKLKLSAPYLDRCRDVLLWENEADKLIGLSLLDIAESKEAIDGYLWLYVHPTERNRGLEKEMIAWGEKRMREVKRERNFPTNLRTYCRDVAKEKIRLLESQHFTIDRYFPTMVRSLAEPIPAPQFPAGFKLTHVSGEQDIQPWVDLFNDSFIDHWNHHDLTVETMCHWMRDENYRPELDLVAVSPEGTFAAFCDCQIKPTQKRESLVEGWIEFLGTGRRFRKMGLGKSMLLAGLQHLKAAGADIAKLSVDADSLTGATKLYQSVGFQFVETWLSWVKPV